MLCRFCHLRLFASFTVFLERKIVKALHGKLHQGQIAGRDAAAQDDDGW